MIFKRIIKWVLSKPKVVQLIIDFVIAISDKEFSKEEQNDLKNKLKERIKDSL